MGSVLIGEQRIDFTGWFYDNWPYPVTYKSLGL